MRSPYDKADSPNLKLHQQQAATTLFEKKNSPKLVSMQALMENTRTGELGTFYMTLLICPIFIFLVIFLEVDAIFA